MAIKEKSKKCNPLVAVLVVVVIALITAISVLLVLRFLGRETKKGLFARLRNASIWLTDWYHEHVKEPIDTIAEKQHVVWNIIESQLLKNTTSTHSGTVLRTAYQACLLIKNKKTVGAALLKDDKDLLEQIKSIGSWPLITPNWDPTSFKLNDWLVKMAIISAPEDFGLFQLGTFRVFLLRPSNPNTLQKAKLEQQIVSLLNHNNIAFNKSRLSADLDQVFTLRQNMLKLYVAANGKEQTMSYAELKKNLPKIDFDKVLYALASPPGTPDPPPKLNFDKITKKMMIPEFKYFAGTDDNLQKLIERTEPRVLANLLIFQHIANAKKPLAEISGCMPFIVRQLPRAALKIFVPYFDHENIQLVSEMVDELKISYAQMFKESEWLSESTRKFALKKVDKMTKFVGYPDGWDKDIEKTYEMLDIKPTDSFLTIESKAAKFRTEQNIAYGIDESLFVPEDHHVDINAYYAAMRNHLSINTAIMDDPMFDATFPMYAKLAGNGQVLGHEIGHAFDSKGRDYDEIGMPNDWWAPTDKKTFEQKSKCFVDQYENYDGALKVPGVALLGRPGGVQSARFVAQIFQIFAVDSNPQKFQNVLSLQRTAPVLKHVLRVIADSVHFGIFEDYCRQRKSGKSGRRNAHFERHQVDPAKRLQVLLTSHDDPVFGKKLNGTLTLAEMMADQLGTGNLWRTYKRLHTSDEPDLVGFEGYSIDKLFFRINALNWCQNPTTNTLDKQLKDNHPTDNFRVSGVVSNMRQFAEAYNCPAGSPMNPEKKCTIF